MTGWSNRVVLISITLMEILVDDVLIAEMERVTPLAPAHNPIYLNAMKDHPALLAWYIADELPPDKVENLRVFLYLCGQYGAHRGRENDLLGPA